MIACRKQFTDTLLELAREDKDIIAVTTDARGSVTLGDYANALQNFYAADAKGQMKAPRYIGLCYENGYGVAADQAEAQRWYDLAKQNGYEE